MNAAEKQHIDYLQKSLASFTPTTVEFILEACERVNLGEDDIKGDRWRGGIGDAMRLIECKDPDKNNCLICSERSDCLYRKCFIHSKQKTPPRPYIIRPELDSKSLYDKGSQMRLEITLLGDAMLHTYRFIKAIEYLGKQGIGTGRGRFNVVDVVTKPPLDFQQMFTNHKTGGDTCRIELLTPLKIKTKEEGIHFSKLPFQTFIRLLLKRIINLNNIYYNGGNYGRSLIKEALGDLVLLSESITAMTPAKWQDFTRYSSRQDKLLKIGGLRGFIMISGNISTFYPFLRIGETVGVGQHTTSGFGRYKIIIN